MPVQNGVKYANVADDSAYNRYRNTFGAFWDKLGYFKGYDDGFEATSPVGSFAPNASGLYDMAGNAWEWCQDCYDENYYINSPAKDPLNDNGCAYRVLRGGSWFSNPSYMRISDRKWLKPGERNPFNGFRVVREIYIDNGKS
jgi:formylglycine-generating enzyme required for sulfatase activity